MTDPQLPGEPGAETAPTTEPTVDFEQRWKDTHANWNTLNERFSKFERDPNAVIEFIREKHPDLLDEGEPDEPEPDEDFEADDDDRPMTVAEFKAYQKQQADSTQARSRAEQFETDLKTFVNGRELDKWGDQAIRFAVQQGQIKGPDDLKKAVDEYLDRQPETKPKPRVPHVPTNGSAATDTPDWDSMTPGQINTYLTERVRAGQE